MRDAGPDDAELVRRLLTGSWNGTIVVGRGVRHDAATLPALLAELGGVPVGLLTYRVYDDAMEVVTIDATDPHRGAGTALLVAAFSRAAAQELRRVWLVTTTDNLDAIRFYQRRGMRVVHAAPGAVDVGRARYKPTIPQVGDYGIGLHDELVLEYRPDDPDPYRDPVATGRAALLRTFRRYGPVDLWALLRDATATRDVVRGLAYPFLGRVDVVVASESRGLEPPSLEAERVESHGSEPRGLEAHASESGGLVLGPLVAAELGIGFVPVPRSDPPAGCRALVVDDGAGARLHEAIQLVTNSGARLAGIALLVHRLSATAWAELTGAGVPLIALVQAADLPPDD